MKKQRVVRGIPVEEGSGNVYRDLGYPNSESMLVKAQLAAKIAEVVQRRTLTQTRTAKILGQTQPKVSALPERAVSRDFGAPFAGMSDPIRPGCPHCDQTDAQEPVERPANAFRSIARGKTPGRHTQHAVVPHGQSLPITGGHAGMQTCVEHFRRFPYRVETQVIVVRRPLDC